MVETSDTFAIYSPPKPPGGGERLRPRRERVIRPAWFVLRLEGVPVRRVNLHDFYQLGQTLGVLGDRVGGDQGGAAKWFGNIVAIADARRLLGQFLAAANSLNIQISQQVASELHSLLPLVGSGDFDRDYDEPIPDQEAMEAALGQLSVLFANELPTLDTYVLDQQGAYSMRILLTEAERMCGEEVCRSLPHLAIQDLREAGRALALNLFTAAGFHMLRATEAVIREYYALIVGHSPKPKHRNWGTYVKALTAAGADLRIVRSIDQIRELQRNPLMHPEVSLDSSDVLTLFGMSQGAIAAMAGAIAKAKTTATSGASPSAGPTSAPE